MPCANNKFQRLLTMRRFFFLIAVCLFSVAINAQPATDTFKCFDTAIPEFPGGNDSLKAFLARNLHYPPKAVKDGIEGRVVIKMLVRKNGKIDSVKIMRSVRNDIDKEAVKVVRAMPRWKPIKDRDVWFFLPVIFKLE
jgi:periplasmic protein TonB